MERRLSVVFSADMVGYSRLMEADEAGTIERQKQHRCELINPAFETHNGRIVKEMGDGILVEFHSVVDAINCSLAIQQAMLEREAAVSEDQRISYRIGINLGDVIVEGSDLLGDGVNVAARLEQLSKPGGICISGTIFDQIDHRSEFVCKFLGEQKLKNISRPVRAYSVRVSASDEIASTWSQQHSTATSQKDRERPSIAVLPFDNMSGDPEEEYFSDGIAEDIITNLSRIRWLFVIARNSTFAIKGNAVDAGTVAREFGVRYVLEGSVRRFRSRVRISAQLIDAQTLDHVWAERYDRELIDVFDVQDEITENVAGALEPAILSAEGVRARHRSGSQLGAWDLVMQAVHSLWRMTADSNKSAVALLQQAIDEFPEYCPAHSLLSHAYLLAAQIGWTDLSEVRDEAERLARRAIELDDQDAWAHVSLGYLQTMNRNSDEAIQEFSTAATLNPNFAEAYGWRSFAEAHAGLSEQAIDDANLALRLSPKDPLNIICYGAIGLAHFVDDRFEKAIEYASMIIRLRPEFLPARRMLCTSLARSSRLDEARSVLQEIKNMQPNISADLLRRTLPHSRPEYLEKFVGGLVLAGL